MRVPEPVFVPARARHRIRRPVASLAIALPLFSCACRLTATRSTDAPAGSPAETDYPGRLVPTTRIQRAFLARQVLRVDWQGHQREFQVVVQMHEGVLGVVGLAPWGGKAFVLEQRGTDVTYTSHLPADVELPFPPRFILQDVSRALLFDALLPWGVAGDPGTRVRVVGEEEVTETWTDGGLVRRSFRRLDGEPPGQIVVDYGQGMRAGVPPRTIKLANEWFGYAIEVETVQYQPL